MSSASGKFAKANMRRFFAPAENFTATSVRLESDETHHLRDVLRLRVGDEVYAMDGRGREFRCRIVEIDRRSAELELLEAAAPIVPESPLDLTLAAAVLTSDNFDLVVQKSVELGVRTLIPLLTVRGDVKVKDPAAKVKRWDRIALEAAKQSGRNKLMSILPPVSFTEFAKSTSKPNVLFFSERCGDGLPELQREHPVTAIVGPAGGWDDAEIETAERKGFAIVTLGGRILRAETAAIAAATIIQHRFGDLN